MFYLFDTKFIQKLVGMIVVVCILNKKVIQWGISEDHDSHLRKTNNQYGQSSD